MNRLKTLYDNQTNRFREIQRLGRLDLTLIFLYGVCPELHRLRDARTGE
jgi:hypothetical protein